MSIIYINPGTEPIKNTSEDNAIANMEALTKAVGGDEFVRVFMWDDNEGRYGFQIWKNDLSVDIDMPGVDPELMQKSKPWESPRMYVNGSSWLWDFAAKIILEEFEQE